MKPILRLSTCAVAALLCACATTDPATFAAQCDVKLADWRHLPIPPPEAVELGYYFGGQQSTRPARIQWFESTKAPRELMACTPSVDRARSGAFTDCATIRMRFSAQVLSEGIDPSLTIPAEITGC